MSAYYNEIDPFAAEWLRGLIDAGHIAPGVVDTRSITEVTADDLRGFTQCHFFAGIGGWSLAARLAGIPDDYPFWSGSCPCQPFSVAGKQRGEDDERHLWPVFRDLIAQCRPAVVAGEQVASKAGRAWLSGVLAEVEELGYAGAGADLCAAGVGAPHIRQRLYWVAYAEVHGRNQGNPFARGGDAGSRPEGSQRPEHGGRPVDSGVALAEYLGREGLETRYGAAGRLEVQSGDDPDGRCVVRGGLGHSNGDRAVRLAGDHGEAAGVPGEIRTQVGPALPERAGATGGLGDALGAGLEGHAGDVPDGCQSGRLDAHPDRSTAPAGGCGPWDDVVWLPCGDGKARPAQPGLEPLAHGVPGRVGRVRAYGNAIVPQVAAEFLIAALESAGEAAA